MKCLKIWFTLALVLLIALTGCSNSQTAQPQATARQEQPPTQTPLPATPQPPAPTQQGNNLPNMNGKQVNIAIENAYLPFNYIEKSNNRPGGWDYDMWQELCKRLNCKPSFAQTRWEDMLTGVATNRFDVAANGITILPERAQMVDFSAPYLAVDLRLLVRQDESRFSEIQGLVSNNGVVGVQAGTSHYETAKKFLPEERIKSFGGLPDAIQALLGGSIDGIIADETTGQGLRGNFSNRIKFIGDSLYQEQLGFAFPKNSELIDPVNQALASMSNDGTLNKIDDTYFGANFAVSYNDIGPGAYGGPVIITNWLGEYFNNTNLTGTPILTRDETKIDFNWASASPDPGIPSNQFSARWSRTTNFAEGKYLFHLSSDDGARVYVDETIIIDNWHPGAQASQINLDLPGGQHTIKVEYFDQSGTAEIHFDWQQYPVAVMTGAANGLTGQALGFTAWGSNDFDGSIAQYQWSFGDGSAASGHQVTHTFTATGVYTVQLTVIDNTGLINTTTQAIKIDDASNKYPVGIISGPTNGFGGQPMYFDGGKSYDRSGGQITGYAWNFGDDSTASGQVISHTYNKPGQYSLLLMVTNTQGLQYTTGTIINIASNTAPQATISGSVEANIGNILSYSSRNTIIQKGTFLTQSIWDFGDSTNGYGANVTHAYARAGKYLLKLTVVDNLGQTSTQSMNITIKAKSQSAPQAIISGNDTALEGVMMYFDGNGSYDIGGTIVKFDWDFGDGAKGTGPTNNHAYKRPGTYFLKLTVLDNEGLTSTNTRRIIIYAFQPGILTPTPIMPGPVYPTPTDGPLPPPPPPPNPGPVARIVSIGGSNTINQQISFSGASSYSPIGTPLVSYSWDMGNGDAEDGMAIDYTYYQAGSYTVSLTVTDADGATDTSAMYITIEDDPPGPVPNPDPYDPPGPVPNPDPYDPPGPVPNPEPYDPPAPAPAPNPEPDDPIPGPVNPPDDDGS